MYRWRWISNGLNFWVPVCGSIPFSLFSRSTRRHLYCKNKKNILKEVEKNIYVLWWRATVADAACAGGDESSTRGGAAEAAARPRGRAEPERRAAGDVSQEAPGSCQSADRTAGPAAQTQTKVRPTHRRATFISFANAQPDKHVLRGGYNYD